ncbi:SDR family oxidoreductase [Aquimarina algicola]|uniref:SDR family oxidoreductase n=1 Tax=Aquimarina algicola TaxID=2589995 RepID=A0A504J9B5_9FLAO|nr:SDR family oxidoreductase [Aquimarina algicola]TPN84468.1 SDR family oxidoreductase [Aquimarina algicola]
MENVLIAGANGGVGKRIVDLLEISEHYKPVAMIRRKDQKKQFESRNIATVVADLEKDISGITEGIDKVIFAAGSGGKKVVTVDQEGAKKLIDLAAKTQIKKFVMLSSMGADSPEDVDKLKEYLRAKHNADEYLKRSNLNFTIVRPGSLTDKPGTGKIILDSKLENSGEISRDDVAETLVKSLQDENAHNSIFEILEGDRLISDEIQKVSSI